MTRDLYEQKRDLLVLSADSVGGFVAPDVLVNHIPFTRIYGDGKVVFIDQKVGSNVIHEGTLTPEQINQLFRMLRTHDFWSFADSYTAHGPTDMPNTVITAHAAGQAEKRVSCYGGSVSAPPGFMECYEQLCYPALQPSAVQTYVRQPISENDLKVGWYYGFEYQKKLNTPRSWEWSDAGRSSRWHQPVSLPTVSLHFDSSYMIPALDGCHRIQLNYQGCGPGAGSTMVFDRNAMSPNDFGDIGMTTLMAFLPRSITLTLLKHADDRSLFSIEIPGYTGPKLRLVIIGELPVPKSGRLLVLNDHDVIQNIYSLQLR